MLPKPLRLNLKTDFKRVAAGKHAQTPNLKLLYTFVSSPSPVLVGISMAKKVLKKAHDRNRVRRIVAQAVQMIYPDLKSGLNLVIIPKLVSPEIAPELLVKELQDVKDLFSHD